MLFHWKAWFSTWK